MYKTILSFQSPLTFKSTIMKTQELNLGKPAEKKITLIAPRKIRLNISPANTSSFSRRWKWLSPIAFAAILCSCNNSDQLVQQYKSLHEHDSIMALQTAAQDSTIKGYVHYVNEIQSNLDEINAREKIISSEEENNSSNKAVADIKALDNLIIRSNKEIGALQFKLKKMGKKDAEMEAVVARMTTQLSEKDKEITDLQNNLAGVNTSYTAITKQFNDTLTVLEAKNSRIEDMTNEMHTVYYAVGTVKELKDNKVITKTGGFIGIGKNTELTPDKNTRYFTKTDLTKLDVIPLNAKFKKLLTTHPVESYKITGDKKADSLLITNPTAFWSEDKYLVVAVK
jgi:hypothetical protein